MIPTSGPPRDEKERRSENYPPRWPVDLPDTPDQEREPDGADYVPEIDQGLARGGGRLLLNVSNRSNGRLAYRHRSSGEGHNDTRA